MRKLHQLLPIAREHLICEEHPRVTPAFYEEYTCFAAEAAYTAKKMTGEEYTELCAVITEEIHIQGHKGSALVSLIVNQLRNRGIPAPWYDMQDPIYWAYRDEWLDEFQRKLEQQNR